MEQDGQTKREEKKKIKGGTEKQRETRLKFIEANASKSFKITNFAFGTVTNQSSEPTSLKTLAAERRESSSWTGCTEDILKCRCP